MEFQSSHQLVRLQNPMRGGAGIYACSDNVAVSILKAISLHAAARHEILDCISIIYIHIHQVVRTGCVHQA